MGREFPHLNKSNAWPGLRTVDPFDLQVTFDPYLWTPDVTIHLCSTPLDPAYEHIGGWRTAAERDSWFDAISDRALTLDTEMHVLPGVEIKLPYAFEILQGYDHLFIDFPPTPTADGSTATHRYYYFLSDVQYRSPSATACIVTLDEWSTHMFDLDMRFIELDRGHAPMAALSVEEYLRNPIENCKNLTTPDENYGSGRSRLKYTAKDVVNAGPHWLVFCMSSDPEQDPGTYGHRENWRVPTTSAYRVEGAMSSLSVFAIEPANANTLINKINEDAPQLLPTVQAVFLVPKRMVQTGTTFTFMTVSCREVEPKQTLSDLITLNRSMFGYPAEYADIAKLYTMPYAWIELADEMGRTTTLAVEETTGRLQVSYIASILAPFLGIDAYVTGIGSSAHDTLTWDNMAGHAFQAYGDWTSGLRHWNIPTYNVLQNSERAFEWLNHWQREQAKASIDNGYDLGIATNNLNYSLRGASLDRQAARLTEQQANGTAQLALTMAADADAVNANVDKMNADYQTDVDLANALSSIQINQYGLAQTNANAMNEIVTSNAEIAAGVSEKYQDYVKLSGTLAIAQSATNFMGNIVEGFAAANNPLNIANNKVDDIVVSTVTQGISDGISIVQTAADANWGNIQAESGLATANNNLDMAKLNASNVNATYNMAMGSDRAMYYATIGAANEKCEHAETNSRALLTIRNTMQQQALSTAQSYQTTMLNGDLTVARYQAAASKGMSDTSITASKDISYESLANAQRAARLGSPQVYSQPTGSMANYTRPQILMAKIHTQDAGAIAAAGDAMLRYGYRMGGRQWSLSNLTPMNTFTYWEGRVRLGTGHVNAVTRNIISQIFANGTTIWKDPSKIGSTSIYENRGQ